MKLIVGLGNPGKKYSLNRHNIGFIILDNFASKKGLSFKKEANYLFAEYNDAVLIKPTTYMNRSGNAVLTAIEKFSIDDILIIVDDIYLKSGDLRFRSKGSDGGHNGLKSIISVLNSQDFKRMRIGVEQPSQELLSDFVLSDFSDEEMKIMTKCFDFSIDILDEYINYSFKELLNYYSRNKTTYSETLFQNQQTVGETK